MDRVVNGDYRLRFGTFEADLSSRKLYKRGRLVSTQEKPFQILSALLEHPGSLITREDLRKRLWPDGTFVDFDKGLNTAVKKLRIALGDSSENPIFIETVPREGYRFIAPVIQNHDNNGLAGSTDERNVVAPAEPASADFGTAPAPGHVRSKTYSGWLRTR
jgi:DNA-binding winged helix-turn-helix (wHTH) protein